MGNAIRQVVWMFACGLITAHGLTPSAHAASGDFDWALGIGGAGSEAPGGIALDVYGNVYVTGNFEGTVDFDPGPGVTEQTSPAGEDDGSIFVAKYSPAGALVWARVMGGTIFSTGQDIAVDAQGNVFVTGWFNQTADLDPGPGEFIVNSPNFGDVFVVKLNTNGEFEWAYALSNSGSSLGYRLTLDPAGHVYVTGRFTGTIEFDPGPGSTQLTSGLLQDIFAVKLDPQGNLIWARAMGGDGANEGRAIGVDGQGNVYIGAWFQGIADLDPGGGSFVRESGGFQDIALIKLNANGGFVWAKTMGGGPRSELWGIAVDTAGNAHIAGGFNGTANFDPDVTNVSLTSQEDNDGFLAKVDTNGNLQWVRPLGTPSNSRGFGVDLDEVGNVYAAGPFAGTQNFNPAGAFNLTSNGANDAFIVKFTATGNFVWAKAFGGPGDNRAHAIAVDPLGAVHVVGRYLLTADFDPGPGQFNITSNGSGDVFVLKLKGEDDAPPVGLQGLIIDADTDEPIACAAVEVRNPSAGVREVAVTDANGRYFFEPLPAGSYSVRVLSPGYATLSPPSVTLTQGEIRSENYALSLRAGIPVVAGRVLDAETGGPLVWVFARLFINGDLVDSSYTCSGGFYEIPLPFAKDDGEIDIEMEFSLPNFETDTVGDTIDPSEGATVNAVLQKSVLGVTFLTGSVAGRVGPESAPLENARITLRGPVSTSAETDADGLYFFDTLIDGTYTVTASREGFAGKSVVRTLVPPGGGQASFELLPNDQTQPGIPGDVNGDGVVNAVDVQLVINAALGIAIDGSFQPDINGDGVVNAVDVQLVINAALGIPIG